MNKRLDVKTGPGFKWFKGFLKRHSELRFKKPKRRSSKQQFDPETVKVYFERLGATLREHDLLDKPDRIFNVDESGLSRKESHSGAKVVGVRGQEHSREEV